MSLNKSIALLETVWYRRALWGQLKVITQFFQDHNKHFRVSVINQRNRNHWAFWGPGRKDGLNLTKRQVMTFSSKMYAFFSINGPTYISHLIQHKPVFFSNYLWPVTKFANDLQLKLTDSTSSTYYVAYTQLVLCI